MFEALKLQPADKIIALMAAYAADPRDGKIDLGVGVYRDDSGTTPIMRAVRAAETVNLEGETTKTYNRLIGDAAYLAAVKPLALGDTVAMERVTASQAPGGTGALHCLFDLCKMARPGARYWISDPSWPNHDAILRHMGLPIEKYPYYDEATGAVDFDAMMAALDNVREGDIVVLHGCCHNPTGANLDLTQWAALTTHAALRGWVPLIDLAYLGLGDGLEEDAAGYRSMVSRLPEAMIGLSFSKNFGLYRDRAGAAIVVAETPDDAAKAEGALATINRLNYSFAPHHSAAIVATVLNDDGLTADWQAELQEMRERVTGLRVALAEALKRETNSDRFNFIAEHRGMFSRLGLTPAEVEALRADHGIYMVGDSRMNIAGFHPDDIDRFAKAVAKTIRP
jgi:aspartate aminotransferase